MANRFFKRVGSLLGRPHILSGRFTADASATADANDRGYTVARDGTGQWTVTFSDAWQNTPNVVATLEHTTIGDTVVSVSTVGTSSFVVETSTAGVLADPAAGSFVHFLCMIDDSNS